MRIPLRPVGLAAATLLGVAVGHAQAPAPMAMPMPMPKPGSGTASPGAATPEQSMMAAMDRMSKAMAAVPMTGNTDHDFVAMMIPHHQGAIDMARFELANGHDPAMRKLAKAVVAAQEREIADMQAWLKAHKP